jgi:hypothetical protein
MKIILVLFSVGCAILTSGRVLADDDQILLGQMHKYGITKCDGLVLKNSKLEDNWNMFTSKHRDDIDKNVKEASVIQVTGPKGDTVKIDVSYIQGPNKCFMTKRSTITFPGSCSENIDMDAWFVSKAMPDKDYTQYENKGGVSMLAKEVTVGNFKACIQEVIIRNSAPFN